MLYVINPRRGYRIPGVVYRLGFHNLQFTRRVTRSLFSMHIPAERPPGSHMARIPLISRSHLAVQHQFIPFTTHSFNQDTQVENSPSIHHETITPSLSRTLARFFCFLHNRSRRWRDVTNLPSLPKKGESLMPKRMFIVGSSTRISGNAPGVSKSAMVADIKINTHNCAKIANNTLVTFFFPIPSNTYSS